MAKKIPVVKRSKFEFTLESGKTIKVTAATMTEAFNECALLTHNAHIVSAREMNEHDLALQKPFTNLILRYL